MSVEIKIQSQGMTHDEEMELLSLVQKFMRLRRVCGYEPLSYELVFGTEKHVSRAKIEAALEAMRKGL